MKKTAWLICVLALVGAQYVCASVVRDPVNSLWPAQEVRMDGRATEWPATPILEEEGLGFQAMNDASNLYLVIRGENRDQEMILSGHYGQDVTLWFVKPDETSRAWGINFDFSHMHPPEPSSDTAHPSAITLSSIGVVPEWVNPQGLVLSTATLPSGIDVQTNLFHRNDQQTLYEIKIPLSMIEHQDHSILADFVTSEANPNVMSRLQSGRSAERSSDGGGDSTGGGGGRHHKGGGSHGGRSQSIEAPNPVDLHLVITLANQPKR